MSRSVFSSFIDALFGRRPTGADAGRSRRSYALVNKDVPPGTPFPYVYVEDDGSARELDEKERQYLRTPFNPTDGARPYVKSRYGERTPDGKLHGYLHRSQLPWRVRVRSG